MYNIGNSSEMSSNATIVNVGSAMKTTKTQNKIRHRSRSPCRSHSRSRSRSRSQSPGAISEIMKLNPSEMPSNSRRAFLQHMVDSLPKTVQNRVLALKHNQLQQIKISEQFFREVYELEKRFYGQSCTLFDARRDIVAGNVEPPTIERYWHEEPDELLEEIKATAEFRQMTEQLQQQLPANAVGVPQFWLTVFRNVALISDLVQEHDEPLLECLVDVRISYDPDSYTIHFQFRPNEYLHTSSLLLTKKYILRHEADKDFPFMFEGPEIVRCEGCHIHWRDGCNLTLQTVRQKRPRKGARNMPKVMPRESFFRFFSPPQAMDLSLADEKTKMVLGADFEVGYLLRTQIVPKAILFYTGDIVDNANDELCTADNTSASISSGSHGDQDNRREREPKDYPSSSSCKPK
ncbi:nucleosome assembly protein 1-like 1-A [Drosophila innubila]|uniref:nucleosome assembly protein 1-like 1-A n=1 Tax=Drosophila innubila TaxID=198719 RepID=UPI00148D40FB|nr:nucleosome assembly protein 1-like 1-A [Drosophila innubila]